MNFIREDVTVACHANVPALTDVYPSIPLSAKRTEILKSCLQLKFETVVLEEQHNGEIPPPNELALLPVVSQARREDALLLKELNVEKKMREEEEERKRQELKEAEAARRREHQQKKEERRQKRLKEKEERRREREAIKKESKAAENSERKKRYQELYDKWCETVEDRKSSLESLRERLATAAERKKALVAELERIDKEKTALLDGLRTKANKSTHDEDHVDRQTKEVSPEATSVRSHSRKRVEREEPSVVKRPDIRPIRVKTHFDDHRDFRASSSIRSNDRSLSHEPRHEYSHSTNPSRLSPKGYRSPPPPPPRKYDRVDRDGSEPGRDGGRRPNFSIRRGYPGMGSPRFEPQDRAQRQHSYPGRGGRFGDGGRRQGSGRYGDSKRRWEAPHKHFDRNHGYRS